MAKYEAFVEKGWEEKGLAQVVVLRERDGKSADTAAFLVDVYCLGVRNAFIEVDLSPGDAREMLDSAIPGESRDAIHPACALKLIEGAVAYAEKLGIAPHRDFRKARRIFSGIDAATCPTAFVYGLDGRPCFIPVESDDDDTVDRVLARLERLLGSEGFTFIHPEVSMADEDDDDSADLVDGMSEEDAREYLLDLLPGDDDRPGFYEFSGLVTAMQLCPKPLSPGALFKLIWPEPDWKSPEQAEAVVSAVMTYWNSIAGRIEETLESGPDQNVSPIDSDVGSDDGVASLALCTAWAMGFLRATREWPESWREPLNRPALAPHWRYLRLWAAAGEPHRLEAIEKAFEERPARTLASTVIALTRALRSGDRAA